MNDVFLQISNLFREESENSILTIQKNNDQYTPFVSYSTDFSTIKSTLECFKEIIGSDRFNRICCKPFIGIDVKKIEKDSLMLTKNFIRKFFVGLLDLQKTDLNEMNEKTEIDDKFRELVKCNTIEDVESLLIGQIPFPNHYKIDNARTSGQGFNGLIERIYVRLQHHFAVINETDKKNAELRDVEMLTSRLADREMQKGELIHLTDGYFYVDHVIIGGGAYISILKDVKELGVPKIICRGTAMRRTATGGLKSGINDILLEIGTMGVKSTWTELSQYLIENKIKSVELLGKSLGGAQAQGLAILIESIEGIEIKKLTTFCSVGVGEAINNLFKEEILQKRTKPFNIQVIRKGGRSHDEVDYIPTIGGVHLGEGSSNEKCKIEVCYIQAEDEEVGVFSNNIAWCPLIKNFFRSFSKAHCYQTTLEKFRWKKVDDNQVNEHLRMGMRLEKIRKCFAYIIHLLTLFLLNARSFASFFYAKLNERKAKEMVIATV